MYVYRAVFLGERAGGSCQTSWKWCRALLARCHRRLRPHPMPAKISREMLQLDRMAVSVLQRRAFRVPCMTRCTWLGSTRTRLCKQLGVVGCASWFAIGDPTEVSSNPGRIMSGCGSGALELLSWFGGRSQASSDFCFCPRTMGLRVSALLVAIGAGVRDVRGGDNAAMAGSSRPGLGLHSRPASPISIVTTLSS